MSDYSGIPFGRELSMTVNCPRNCVVLILPLLLFSIALSGCATGRAANLDYVDFNARTPLPGMAPSEILPLRLAVAAIISPQGTAESYQIFAQYLQNELGRPVELVQRRTYAEVNDLIRDGRIDMAFVCTSAYVEGRDRFGMELLVAPEINGGTVYYSDLIVPTESTAKTIADLKGKRFAFTDPMSFSGRVHPTYLLHQLGTRPETFFSKTFFTYSHDRAIEAVADGIADGAAVDSLVLDYAVQRNPNLRNQLKTIQRSQPFGIPPVVVPPDLSPKQKRLLQDTLLTMHENAEGKAVLAELGIDRFVRVDDHAYGEVRRLILETGELP